MASFPKRLHKERRTILGLRVPCPGAQLELNGKAALLQVTRRDAVLIDNDLFDGRCLPQRQCARKEEPTTQDSQSS